MTFWTYIMQTFTMGLWKCSPYQHQNRKVDDSGYKYLKRDFSELLNYFTWPAFTLFLFSLSHLMEESAASLLEMNESQKCYILPIWGVLKQIKAGLHRPTNLAKHMRPQIVRAESCWYQYLYGSRAKAFLAWLWKQIGEGLPDSSSPSLPSDKMHLSLANWHSHSTGAAQPSVRARIASARRAHATASARICSYSVFSQMHLLLTCQRALKNTPDSIDPVGTHKTIQLSLPRESDLWI